MTLYLLIGVSLLVLMALRVPVALAMIISSILTLLVDGTVPMIVVPQRLWGSLESFPLLAIPFFVFAGVLMNHGGGAEAIFRFFLTLLGHIRGGLAYVNVMASVVFAGMSGAATADAAGLGAIEIEAMKRSGYRAEFAAAVTAASSTIGPIIPPSVPLIVYGVMAQVSVGELFIAGIVPGLLMGVAMMAVIAIVLRKENHPVESRSKVGEIASSFLGSFWALLAPLVILGGIFSGVFTPTEAGAVAALYALVLGIIYKGIRWNNIGAMVVESLLATAQVTFIVAAAGLFGWVLTRYGFPKFVAEMLLSITADKHTALLLIALAMLLAGCFIDALSLLIMMTPVVVPIALAFGIDLTQMGVVLVLACMIGLNTPPVGICLYIVSDLARVPMMRVAKEMIPFYMALLVTLVLISLLPFLTTYLPSVIKI
ncbi:MAG: TRAP transporter large permease [Neoaquamicrobium sediminum]|uniref:TRAP transporter large permease n=1 Tax=Neoaquamicrobium sediminum TaxID=1849104 RepID=UPI004035C227